MFDRKERLEAVKEQERLFSNDCGMASLPEICLAIRAAANGAADPWTEEKIDETIAMLRRRLDTWYKSVPQSKRFDDSVREMVLATIEEVKLYCG